MSSLSLSAIQRRRSTRSTSVSGVFAAIHLDDDPLLTEEEAHNEWNRREREWIVRNKQQIEGRLRALAAEARQDVDILHLLREEEAVALSDAFGKRKLGCEEFVAAVVDAIRKGQGHLGITIADSTLTRMARALFQEIDCDGSKTISFEQFSQYLVTAYSANPQAQKEGYIPMNSTVCHNLPAGYPRGRVQYIPEMDCVALTAVTTQGVSQLLVAEGLLPASEGPSTLNITAVDSVSDGTEFLGVTYVPLLRSMVVSLSDQHLRFYDRQLAYRNVPQGGATTQAKKKKKKKK
eukprot:RCo045947